MELLTSGEAARLLGLTPDAVRAMERRGVLEALRTLNGRRIFRGEDVRRLVIEREKEPSGQRHDK